MGGRGCRQSSAPPRHRLSLWLLPAQWDQYLRYPCRVERSSASAVFRTAQHDMPPLLQ